MIFFGGGDDVKWSDIISPNENQETPHVRTLWKLLSFLAPAFNCPNNERYPVFYQNNNENYLVSQEKEEA